MDYEQQSILSQENTSFPVAPEVEVTEVEDFSYTGYQVVRSEFFSHIYEPSVSFKDCKIQFNMACLKKMPTVEYVQFLVNAETKSLVARPCREDDKDAFAWCTAKRKPRQITGRLFFAKIVSLMGWNPNHRYKLLGKLIRYGNEYLFLFDMTATEVYQRTSKEGEKPKTSRTPVFPAEWQNQFGLPVEEHRKSLQVNIFDSTPIRIWKNYILVDFESYDYCQKHKITVDVSYLAFRNEEEATIWICKNQYNGANPGRNR